jgi:uncharacterized protein
MNRFIKKILIPICILIPTICFAASFDCTKAKSPVEKVICTDTELSKLDEDLSKVYKDALKEHPVENYVKTRQRAWIKTNSYCDKSKLANCLKENYKGRIKQLNEINKIQVYSNSNKFSYENGDAVAEIRQDGTNYLISLWGGARLHSQASKDNGKDTYTECEFEGTFTSPKGGKAIDKTGESFVFALTEKNLTYEDNRQNCPGFAGLPDVLNLIQKNK